MRRILVVEDDATLREVYKTILSTQPYICDTAENGQEALKKCENHTYDLILLDLMMPIMDGVEFIDTYKDFDTMKSKIIVLSNLSSGKDFEYVRKKGVSKTLVKSDLSPNELISAIRFGLESAD